MKIKLIVPRSNRSGLRSSSKLYLYDTRSDKEYYGKCMSLREKILLGKLFGAIYDDITKMLPGGYARESIPTQLKSRENLRLKKESIQVAKRRLISHALKIVNIDNSEDSKILSDCCSCYSHDSTIPLCELDRSLRRHEIYTSREVSGCRAKTANRAGKGQVKRICSDLGNYKFNKWKEKECRTEMKQILDRNYVKVFDSPYKFNTSYENNMFFFKNYKEDRQTGLVEKNCNENLTTFETCTPVNQTFKMKTGNLPFQKIENGMNEYVLKQPNPITHRLPCNSMANSRIPLNKINNCEHNIQYRYDKAATGDISYETDTKVQPIVKINHENNDTNLLRLALRRRFCTLTLKPYDNKLDVMSATKTLAKSLRYKIGTTFSSQCKSVSERSKIIKKANKRNIRIARHRCRKDLNEVKVKTNNKIPNSESNFKSREVKNGTNSNIYCIENLPHLYVNSDREPFILKESTSKFQSETINEATKIKKISGGCSNHSYKLMSHHLLDYIAEIDQFNSTDLNVSDKKPQPFQSKPFFSRCFLHESLESTNKIEQNEHSTRDCKKLMTQEPEPKSTMDLIQKHKHTEIPNVQTSLRSQINNISIDSKLKQSVRVNRVNSTFRFDNHDQDIRRPITEQFKNKSKFDVGLYEKKSPLLPDVYICQRCQQYREAEFQTKETHQETHGHSENHSKASEIDITYDEMGRKHGTIVREVKYPRRGLVSKKIQLKSFDPDNDFMRQEFGFVTDISCARPNQCTSFKQIMATDFITQAKLIMQRTKSSLNFSSPLMNKSCQTRSGSYQDAGSEIMNIEFSRKRKIRHTYEPNVKPYLIHDLSNKNRNGNSHLELPRERPVNCKTSFSCLSSILTCITTNQSFLSNEFKKYKQNTSHEVNSIFKSSFYAFNINVNNTHTEKKEKLERKKRLAETKRSKRTDSQEAVKKPFSLTGRRRQAVRLGSKFSFDIEFSKASTLPAGDNFSERKQDRSTEPKDTYSSKSVSQDTHTDKKFQHAESQSHPETQHVAINTQPKRCFCTLKLHKMGRVYKEQGVAANLNQPKPNVLKETGTVTTKKNNHKAAVIEVELEPYECEPGTCIPGECDPKACLKRIKKRNVKSRAVGADKAPSTEKDISSTVTPAKKKDKTPTAAPGKKKEIKPTLVPDQKRDVSAKQACRVSSNFSFSIEFIKQTEANAPVGVEEEPKGKGLFRRQKVVFPQQKVASVFQRIACQCFKKKEKQNQNSKKSAQSNVKSQKQDGKKVKEVGMETDSKQTKEMTTTTLKKKDKTSKKVGQNSKIQQRSSDYDTKEITMGTDMKPEHTKEETPHTHKKKDKISKKAKEVGKNSASQARLADLDPYECEPGTCIPGKCNPKKCLEIIKKRGLGTDISPEQTKEATTTTQKKKDKKGKKVKEVSQHSKIQNLLADLDPYECEPGTCIPGKCDPKKCLEIIKKRGMGTSIGTETKLNRTTEGTTTTHKKKDRTRKTGKAKSVGDSAIQGTRPLGDSQVAELLDPEHDQGSSRTGSILKRCFCTAKLQGIEVPPALTEPVLKSKKVKQKPVKKITEKPKVEGNSQNSQTDTSNKAEQHKMAMNETEKRKNKIDQGRGPKSKNLSPSVVRIGSNFEFNVEFSKQVSGMNGDGPDDIKPNTKPNKKPKTTTKPNKKQEMVTSTESPANPKTKAKGSGLDESPVQSQDTQVVRGKKAEKGSGVGIVLRRCFCTLSLQKSKA